MVDGQRMDSRAECHQRARGEEVEEEARNATRKAKEGGWDRVVGKLGSSYLLAWTGGSGLCRDSCAATPGSRWREQNRPIRIEDAKFDALSIRNCKCSWRNPCTLVVIGMSV
jgi:hypothetical protein